MEDWSALFNATEMLAQLQRMPAWIVYLVLAISSVIENVFPPWPGDTVTVIGGVLAATGLVSLGWSMLSLVIGNLIGAYIMYFLGQPIVDFARRVHARIARPVIVKNAFGELVSEENLERATVWFGRWGATFVLVSRFSAGIRFFVSIVAGISRMNLLLFSVVFTLGVLVWNTLLLAGGYALGKQWDQILIWLRIYNTTVMIVLAVLLAAFLLWRWHRSRSARALDP